MLCQEPGVNCVAEATRGDRCSVHGAGFHRADGAKKLQCRRCRMEIEKGHWYRIENRDYFHVKKCKPRGAATE